MASLSRLGRAAATLGLGVMIHLLQILVTDAGTVIAWTWTGH